MANKKTSIGGQALIEGIMMRGPEKTAMAVRNAKGRIIIDEWETSNKVPKFFKLPFFRGIYALISSYGMGYKCLMRSADISLSDIEDQYANDGKKEETAVNKTEESVSEAAAGETQTAEDNTVDQDIPSIDETPAVEEVPAIEETPAAKEDSAAKENKADKKEADKKPGDNKATLAIITVIALVLGIGLAISLFVFVPSLIAKLIISGDDDTLTGSQALLRSVLEGVIKIVLLILYMWGVSFMPDIKRTFMYHGAEHKTIFCYEHGLPLTVENIKKERRFHPRCGTSFLILMLIVGICIGFFIRIDNAVLRTVIKLALLPLTVGIGYELIKFAGRHDNILTKIISFPGVMLQHITTKEPDDSMIECAVAAMEKVIPEDQTKDNW